MPEIFDRLKVSLSNVRNNLQFASPLRAMEDRNMYGLLQWLRAKEPDYDETFDLLLKSPNVDSAATLGGYILDNHPQDYQKALNACIDHVFETQQGRMPGNAADLTSTKTGTMLLGLLSAWPGGKNKISSDLVLPVEQEFKLMQIADERAYKIASEKFPAIHHYVDYAPMFSMDAASFSRFCRLGSPRHAGLEPEKRHLDEPFNAQVPQATAFRGILVNAFAEHLTNCASSPTLKPRYDLVETALASGVFTPEALDSALETSAPQNLSRTEAIGARKEARLQFIERVATAEWCIKEADKLPNDTKLDPAFAGKLNELYAQNPDMVTRSKNPESLIRHLEGRTASLEEIGRVSSNTAQYIRIQTALKANSTPEGKDAFCLSVLEAMKPGQPLSHLAPTFGTNIWLATTSQLSPEYQEKAATADKNWNYHLAAQMDDPSTSKSAARHVSNLSVSHHYNLVDELLDKNDVQTLAGLSEFSTRAMVMGTLSSTAHRPALMGKIASKEMLEVVFPKNDTKLDTTKTAPILAGSDLLDMVLDNKPSPIPAGEKAGMLKVILDRCDLPEPTIGKFLGESSPHKPQLLVQIMRHGSPETRKNLLLAAVNCPDEILQETVVDEVLTRPLTLGEKDLGRFAASSPRTQDMLTKAVSAKQLMLPGGLTAIPFDQNIGPDM